MYKKDVAGRQLCFGKDIFDERRSDRFIPIKLMQRGSVTQEVATRAASAIYGVRAVTTQNMIELQLVSPMPKYEDQEMIFNRFCEELERVYRRDNTTTTSPSLTSTIPSPQPRRSRRR